MTVNTTILISNLHCSSCVNTIKEALSALSPAPLSITTSIVSQSVSIEHDAALTKEAISHALDDAGFDLVDTPQLEGYRIQRSASYISDLLSKKQKKHAAQCLLCQQDGGVNTHKGSVSKGASCCVDDHIDEKAPLSRIVSLDLSGPGKPQSRAQDLPGDNGYHASFSVGGMTCASCVGAVTRAASDVPGVSNVAVNLVGKSATATLSSKDLVGRVVEAIQDGGYECELVNLEPILPLKIPTSPTSPRSPRSKRSSRSHDQHRPLSATFSIGGMTCASCVGNVQHAASTIDGVSDVAVNLVGKSATATLENKELLEAFIEAVEDGGYEAEVVDVTSLHGSEVEDEAGPRLVTLRIDGMFCPHCPPKIDKALQTFGDRVLVESRFKAWDDPKPHITLSYTPDAPSFTLRDIISAIKNSASPPFNVTVAKPPSLEERARLMHRREQRQLLMRLLSAFILAVPTFIIGIVYMTLVPSDNTTRMWFMSPLWAGNVSRAEWALFILATPAMFYSAGQFHRRSIKEMYALWKPGSKAPLLRRFVRFGSMNLLVSFGVSIAYFASIALLALAAAQSPHPHGEADSTTYFDSVVFLTMFLLAGRYLEAYSKGRTADAVTALGKLRPTEALVLVPEAKAETPESSSDVHIDLEKGVDDNLKADKPGMRVQRINTDLLEIGDIVRVPHGATPPTDGVIISRHGGQFDESSLTGESRPITKHEGDKVFVGTINRGSAVDVEVTALGGETMLDQIVKVVREGQTRRAPIEKLADVITGYFVPVITLLAILTWVIWLSLGFSGSLPQDYLDIPIGGWAVWALEFAIAVFVVACPCGIGLAAPTALLVGSGLAAKYGILVRGGGEAFQEAAQLDILVFDKTGTLTEGGEPRVTDSDFGLDGTNWSKGTILNAAHALEEASSHPLALAVRAFCEAQPDAQLSSQGLEDIEEVAGRGLKGRFVSPASGYSAIIGNEKWMEENGAKFSVEQERLLSKWQSEGKSVVAMSISSSLEESKSYKVVGIFAVADTLRPEARDVVLELQRQGLGTWMISGDNPTTAKAVAKSVGIPETNVIAGVMPHQKAEKIAWLQQTGLKRELGHWKKVLGIKQLNERAVVGMVGDGINDAPALSAADVSVAVGSGSDVAISSASFILIKSDLRSLLTLTDLSRRVFNRVKFNFFWAFIYNLVALPIAAGVIYPAGHARLDPVWASLAMALSSVTVVLSSLLLRLYHEPKIGKTN